MTLLVSLWFLFCFVFIWDESVTSSFNQKYQKSFYSYDKNKLFSYDNIRGIQQARSISFLSFFGESTIKRVNKSEIFNPRTTMTMISSVNTDIGAECFSVALEPSTSRKAARRPTTWAGSDLTTIKSAKKKKRLESRMFMSLCYTRDYELNNDTRFSVSSSMSSYSAFSIQLVLPNALFCYTLVGQVTFSQELRWGQNK